MTRRFPAVAGITILVILILADYFVFRPNPYQQPAIVALGSGAASEGGFCGALPE